MDTFVVRSESVDTPIASERESDPIERILALGLPFPEAKKLLMREFEQRYVARALENSGGHVGKAAQMSGIAGRYFRLIRARNRPAA